LTLLQHRVTHILVGKEHDHETGEQVEAVIIHLIFKINLAAVTSLIIYVIGTLCDKAVTVGEGFCATVGCAEVC